MCLGFLIQDSLFFSHSLLAAIHDTLFVELASNFTCIEPRFGLNKID